MFAGIPRVRCMRDEYTLSASKEELKKRNHAYYKEYTREEAQNLKKLYYDMCRKASDYDISNKKKILYENFKPHGYQTKKEMVKTKKPSFIPLTPSELNNVTVTPFMIQLEGIVPETFANTAITIKNTNEFSIRVYVAPRKKGVLEFPEGNRKIVKANREEDVTIRYKAESIGKHYIVIDVIINECHGCECIIQTRVIPAFVTADVTHIEFMSNGSPRRYVKLINPCNKEVTFTWENTTESLIIMPQSGKVPPKRFMYCKVNYIPVVSEKLATEIILSSERKSGPKMLIDVFATLVKAKVGLSTDHLEMPFVPLNIPTRQKVILRNFRDENVFFKVIDPSPIHGVTVTPTQGILFSFGDQTFYVNVCIPTCVDFSCIVKIEVQKIDEIQLKISGSVEYPQVIVKPNTFHLRKVFLGSFDRFRFQVENCGNCMASIKFCFELYPEFYVSNNPEKQFPAVDTEGIMLEPQTQRTFYLHFDPIDVAPNCFYLPIIINNILGPPSKIRTDTISSVTYLGPALSLYQSEFVEATDYPAKLNCVEISNTVCSAILQFSNLKLNFYKYTHVTLKSVDNLNVFVTNVSQDVVAFNVLLKNIKGPFVIQHLEGGEVNCKSDGLSVTLNPTDEVILNVRFTTTEPGSYTDYAPIFIENMNNQPYNHIILLGNIYEPTIEIPNSTVYMLPVPLGVQCESHFTAAVRYHDPQCSISAKSSIQELLVTTYRENTEHPGDLDENTKKLHVAVFHTASIAAEYAAVVTLECSCGAYATFTVKGAADDCVLTTHFFRGVHCVKDNERSMQSVTKIATVKMLTTVPLPAYCLCFSFKS